MLQKCRQMHLRKYMILPAHRFNQNIEKFMFRPAHQEIFAFVIIYTFSFLLIRSTGKKLQSKADYGHDYCKKQEFKHKKIILPFYWVVSKRLGWGNGSTALSRSC